MIEKLEVSLIMKQVVVGDAAWFKALVLNVLDAALGNFLVDDQQWFGNIISCFWYT